jgi:hypothetical protein
MRSSLSVKTNPNNYNRQGKRYIKQLNINCRVNLDTIPDEDSLINRLDNLLNVMESFINLKLRCNDTSLLCNSMAGGQNSNLFYNRKRLNIFLRIKNFQKKSLRNSDDPIQKSYLFTIPENSSEPIGLKSKPLDFLQPLQPPESSKPDPFFSSNYSQEGCQISNSCESGHRNSLGKPYSSNPFPMSNIISKMDLKYLFRYLTQFIPLDDNQNKMIRKFYHVMPFYLKPSSESLREEISGLLSHICVSQQTWGTTADGLSRTCTSQRTQQATADGLSCPRNSLSLEIKGCNNFAIEMSTSPVGTPRRFEMPGGNQPEFSPQPPLSSSTRIPPSSSQRLRHSTQTGPVVHAHLFTEGEQNPQRPRSIFWPRDTQSHIEPSDTPMQGVQTKLDSSQPRTACCFPFRNPFKPF